MPERRGRRNFERLNGQIAAEETDVVTRVIVRGARRTRTVVAPVRAGALGAVRGSFMRHAITIIPGPLGVGLTILRG